MPTTANGVSEVVSEESSVLDEQQSPPESQEPKLTARELKMLEMTQRIREEREAEGGSEPEAAVSAQAPAPELANSNAQSPQPSAVKTEGGFDIFEKDGKQFVRLKAYGQVEEIPLETALRRAQKDVAAEKKLKEAIERERRAAYAEQAAAQKLNTLAAQPRISTSAQPTEDDVDLKGTLEKLYQGDIDSAAAELDKVIRKGRQQATPQVSAEVIAAQVEQRLQQSAAAKAQAKYDADLVEAVSVYEEEFPDLAQDTRLSAYFDRETELLMAQHPEKSMLEVVREAGKTIRALSQPAQQPSNPRLDLKRAAPKHITAARVSSVSTNIEPAPPPRTPSSVIADMRKARGQAPR